MSELQHKSVIELQEQLAEFSRELLDYRMQHAGRTLTKTHMLTLRRRDVARVQTMLNVRRRESEQEVGKEAGSS